MRCLCLVEFAKKLRRRGYSLRKIAEVLGVHHMTVRRWIGEPDCSPERILGTDGRRYPVAGRDEAAGPQPGAAEQVPNCES